MEDERDMYEAFYRMSKMVDIIYESYEEKMAREEWEKERVEEDFLSTPLSVHSSSSSPFHHSNEEISQSLKQRILN